MLIAKPPTFLTFDCYGTLIDWDTGLREIFTEILRRKGAQVDVETFRRQWEALQFEMIQGAYRPYKDILKESLELTLKAFGLRYEPREGEDFAESMPRWKPFPDTRPALERLATHCRLAIISNVDDDIIMESSKLIGVGFDAILTAEQARAYKPSRRIFDYALSKLNCPPVDITHVAFGLHYDIEPAKELGIKTVWVNRKGEAPEGPVQALAGQADFEIRDLYGLWRLVEV